uniref:PNPLA domain-containing protein n=1 Tax=Macrostomum lignano TaxID=282301 RepID=A0A1I8FEW5_9PLAT
LKLVRKLTVSLYLGPLPSGGSDAPYVLFFSRGMPSIRNSYFRVVNHEGILSYWASSQVVWQFLKRLRMPLGAVPLCSQLAQVAAMAPSFTLVGVACPDIECHCGQLLRSNPCSFSDISPADIEKRATAASEQPPAQGGDEAFHVGRWEKFAEIRCRAAEKSGLLALTDFNYVKDQPMMYFMRANMALADDAVMEMAPMAVGGRQRSRCLPSLQNRPSVEMASEKSKQKLTASRSPLNIVSRRSFFIRPVLPYAIVRGEKFCC